MAIFKSEKKAIENMVAPPMANPTGTPISNNTNKAINLSLIHI